MGICAWCGKRVKAPEQHNRLCVSLSEALEDGASREVNAAALILYWWVQEKRGSDSRAETFRKRCEDRVKVLS